LKVISEKNFKDKISHLKTYSNSVGIEKNWFVSNDEKMMATIIYDLNDRDFVCVFFAVDKNRTFQFFDVITSIKSYHEGINLISNKFGEIIKKRNLFIEISDKNNLNPRFKRISECQQSAPARILLQEVFNSYNDKDGNFLEQLQTSGFDARIFELYLYAYFSEEGYKIINTSSPFPDFCIEQNEVRVGIEAVTANPAMFSIQNIKNTQKNTDDYFHEEAIIKFAEVLTKKFHKKYWENSDCKNLPFVIAIEDFHKNDSLIYSFNALFTYLYGIDSKLNIPEKNEWTYRINNIDEHIFENKKISLNFFRYPDAENISAVMFTNAGTYAKFNRMAYQAGYGKNALKMERSGLCYSLDPDSLKPDIFSYNVGNPSWIEPWGQGLIILHNPTAKFPLPIGYFKDACEYYFENAELKMLSPKFHPINSKTITTVIKSKC